MLRLFDIFVFVILAYIGFEVIDEGFLNVSSYQLLTLSIILVATIVFAVTEVYRDWNGSQLYEILSNLVFSWSLVILITGAALFSLKLGAEFSRLWVGISFGGSVLISIASRLIKLFYCEYQFRSGKNQKNIVIVGANEFGQSLVRRMRERSWSGLVPCAFFDTDTSCIGEVYQGVPVIGGLECISSYVEDSRRLSTHEPTVVKEVWIALPLTSKKEIALVRNQLSDSAAKMCLVPNTDEFDVRSIDMNKALDLPLIDLSVHKIAEEGLQFKRLIDFFIATIALVVLMPVLLLVAVLIKVDSAGPVLFKQRRYGLDGCEFNLWKFRSMTSHAFQSNEVEQARVDDARVTRVGKWIRKYSIDELPQLVNVIIGEMSLVGPRPHATSHNEYYRKKIDGYMSRHSIRPGITGWAQVNGYRGETPELADMEQRVNYDLEYVRTWSISLDLTILFRTAFVIISAKNAH